MPRPELTEKSAFKLYVFKIFKCLFYFIPLSFSFGENRSNQTIKKKRQKNMVFAMILPVGLKARYVSSLIKISHCLYRIFRQFCTLGRSDQSSLFKCLC